jgi:hypothetical protein
MENVDMKKLPEAVSNQFSELFLTLDKAMDDLKMTGAEACLIGDFSQVTTINDSCQRLQAFKSDIKATMNNFESNFKTPPMENGGFYKNDSYRTRKSGGRLRVTIADKVFEEPTIAQTFVKTLKAFGLERVARLNKIVTAIPLMAKTPVINSYQTQRLCDGWYVTTHVNKHTATTVLKEISRQMNMPVKIEFIER